MNVREEKIPSLDSSIYTSDQADDVDNDTIQMEFEISETFKENSISTFSNDKANTVQKPPSNSNSDINQPRRKFTEEEDRYLTQLVDEMGAKNWESIAQKMPNRTARQCRDRYSNYLVPGFFNGEWSAEEDENLYKKYQEIGPKWTVIHQFFKNRSPNSLKNRWNYFVSRSNFKMNQRQNNSIYVNNQTNFCQQPFYQQHYFNNNNQINIFKNHGKPYFQQKLQYYGCYNQFPINTVPNINYNNKFVQKFINKPKNTNIGRLKNNKLISQIPHNKKIDGCEKNQIKNKNIEQKLNDLPDIQEPTDAIFSLHLDQKNPEMFDEDNEEYINNMYSFDDPELFSF
ncbi:hypothetical protein M9Y10_042159 [Tritrichomonas musculus]|uniref:Myb-like DNA-binding domain containing protein n=1 Tax=Tritrichomonas musculus TaxID=1915356 RepID=A0ABR2K6Y5_9EUKA